MTGGMAAFLVAVGGTSLIGYLLVNRGQNRTARRGNASGSDSGSGASYDSGGNGWNICAVFSSDSYSADTAGSRGARAAWRRPAPFRQLLPARAAGVRRTPRGAPAPCQVLVEPLAQADASLPGAGSSERLARPSTWRKRIVVPYSFG